jgi:hypothetical protein
VKPLEEPLESLRRLLQEARQKIDRPIEIILIGGAAALLSEAVNRITDDIDILASKRTVAALQWVFRAKTAPNPLAKRHSFRSKSALVPKQIGTSV